MFDTGAWTWARDRRFPELAAWFNVEVAEGRVLLCDLVILELIRLTPNESRAKEVAARLDAFERVSMRSAIWVRARELQGSLAANGDHRRAMAYYASGYYGVAKRQRLTHSRHAGPVEVSAEQVPRP